MTLFIVLLLTFGSCALVKIGIELIIYYSLIKGLRLELEKAHSERVEKANAQLRRLTGNE